MNQDVMKNPFDKVMMTGVFIGIVITVISITFDAIFLESTSFPYTAIINVSSLIFSINLLFLVIGAIYYGFSKIKRYGNIAFAIFFALITIILLLKVRGIDRTNDLHLNIEFRALLSGIIVITAIGALIFPLLLNNKGFRKHVI